MKHKRIREFAVPRGRVPTEVSQAFQQILLSLRNLDKAVGDQEATAAEIARLRQNINTVRRSQSTPTPTHTTQEITYASEFGVS